jgi:hypothetical protein
MKNILKLFKKPCKSLNERLGMSNEAYSKQSEDLALLCVDRLATTGKLDHYKLSLYAIEEVRFKHFGETKAPLSQYEKDIFIAGMIQRYLLLPETETRIGVAAYAKQLEEGLNDFDCNED